MPLEDIISQLRSAKVRAGTCTRPQDLARAVAQYQQTVENVVQEITTELINIINTGGGATTPVYIIRALVNQVGGIAGSSSTFNFDGATDLFTYNGSPSGVTTGTAQNIQARAFADNEPVILTSFNGTIWFADKIATNTIRALVNESGGVITSDSTFDFDNASAITGVIPVGGAGTAVNAPATAYADNEVVILVQADDGTWRVLQDDDDLGGGGGGTGGEVYTPGFGIMADSLNNSNVVELDYSSPTGYDPGIQQIPSHNTSNEFRWLGISVITINLV